MYRNNSLPSLEKPCASQNIDKLLKVSPDSEYARLEIGLQLRTEEIETGDFDRVGMQLPDEERMRNARDRFANKVLARLYARQAFTSGLQFSRGHFLCDTTRMVSGTLANTQMQSTPCNLDSSFHYTNASDFHTSTIIAGPDGCAAMVFSKEALISFFDAHPGVLLSLLGTQVVV